MPTPRTIRTPLLLQCIVLLLACLLSPQHAQAAPDKRVALLIGNARYTSGLPPLSNPPKDTAALEASLKKLNFSVQRITDGDQKAMGRAIKQFGTDAQDAQVAFFYYSGHGMQARDENYLIPIAAQIETEAELDGEAINLRGVLRQIEDARPQNAVIVLDACRDNPVAGRSKNASKGLSRVQSQPTNTLVVFAAQAGTTASDNGVFAKALASHITQPNVGMRVVFDNVGKAVRSASGNKQSIQRDDQLSEDIVLLASVGVVPAGQSSQANTTAQQPSQAPVQRADPEDEAWQATKAANTAGAYDAYLAEYPTGRYASAARIGKAGLVVANSPQQTSQPISQPGRPVAQTATVSPQTVSSQPPARLIASTHAMVAPDIAENGAVVPVGVNFTPPLNMGDVAELILGNQSAATIRVEQGSLQNFYTRLRFQRTDAVRLRVNAQDLAVEKRVAVTLPGEVPTHASFAGDRMHIRANAGEIRVLVPAKSVNGGTVQLEADGLKVRVDLTGLISENPYFSFKSPVAVPGEGKVVRLTLSAGGKTRVDEATSQ